MRGLSGVFNGGRPPILFFDLGFQSFVDHTLNLGHGSFQHRTTFSLSTQVPEDKEEDFDTRFIALE